MLPPRQPEHVLRPVRARRAAPGSGADGHPPTYVSVESSLVSTEAVALTGRDLKSLGVEPQEQAPPPFKSRRAGRGALGRPNPDHDISSGLSGLGHAGVSGPGVDTPGSSNPAPSGRRPLS